jgi:dihydrofolate synthase / folylpolyglutamate synthase
MGSPSAARSAPGRDALDSVNLQQSLETLYGLERRRDKLGLEGTRALLAALGHPERRFRAIHVAGTNGKGTTCALIERVLRVAGVRTGLFTSPHLVDFRERIRVDGRWADGAALERALERITALPEGKDRTFFEVATALGFGWFAEAGAEWAVVEVGLGGRLDTTNVLTPEVCVITPIALDHTEILGSTIAQVAAEKAGIIKPGVPVVIGAGMEAPAAVVVREVAAERGAPLFEVPALDLESVPAIATWAASALPWGPLALEPGSAGRANPANLATALAALAVFHERVRPLSAAAVSDGVREARWPGRLEHSPHELRLWWDGAHNPAGARALEAGWRRLGLAAPGAVVMALSRDKDVDGILEAIERLAPGAPMVATCTRNERAMEPARIVQAMRARGIAAREAADVAAACRAALDLVGDDQRVLLLGSLFAVGDAMRAFGGAPGERL